MPYSFASALTRRLRSGWVWYGYKPEEVRCNGVGIGVWRKEEAFQKLGDIGAFMRFVDHKAKARIEFNYDPDFPAALLITHAATKT